MLGSLHGYARLAAIVIAGATSMSHAEALAKFAPSASVPEARTLDDQGDAFRRSSDLRLRIVYSTETKVIVDEHEQITGIAVDERIPVADLVEQARGSTDPLVLGLMVQRCAADAKRPSCDAVEFARRWVQADTQNQLAWLTLASVLKARSDVDGARTTFLRAALASSWHEHYGDLARVLAGAVPLDIPPRLRHAVLTNALGQAATWGIPSTAVKTLGDYCKEDGDVRAACARLVATMFRDDETLTGLTLAAPFAQRAHMDSTIVASYLQKSEAVHWAIVSLATSFIAPVDLDTTDDEAVLRDNARLQAMIDLGERSLGEQRLLAHHVSPSEAAARFVATLSPDQLERRAAVLASH